MNNLNVTYVLMGNSHPRRATQVITSIKSANDLSAAAHALRDMGGRVSAYMVNGAMTAEQHAKLRKDRAFRARFRARDIEGLDIIELR